MTKNKRYRLKKQREFAGQKPGEALANWLNNPPVAAENYLEEFLADAQTVFRVLADYTCLSELKAAHQEGTISTEFWKCHERLNEKLAKFSHVPQINLHEVFDGARIDWLLAVDELKDPLTALLSQQVQWIVQLIDQDVVLNVRKCQECTKWYFARFSHQEFCSSLCRNKNFAKTEVFKQKRRDYMRDYYRRKKSGNVESNNY